MISYFRWFEAFHVISVIMWMAGMLYLPRLYVYHAKSLPGSEISETFKIMERRLLYYITTPAMVFSASLGLTLMFMRSSYLEHWFHVKVLAVLGMFAIHGLLAKHCRLFANDLNTKSPLYFKIVNELVTVLIVVIVIMVVTKPF